LQMKSDTKSCGCSREKIVCAGCIALASFVLYVRGAEPVCAGARQLYCEMAPHELQDGPDQDHSPSGPARQNLTTAVSTATMSAVSIIDFRTPGWPPAPT
jgi:hypothetical protein